MTLENHMKRIATFIIGIAIAAGALAKDKPRVRVATLTFPAISTLIFNVMKDRQIDARHGFDLEIQPYPSISAYNISLAKGEVDALIAGPTVLQKLKLEGGPIRIAATAVRPSDLGIVTANPAIKSFADLRGKQLAADVGSAQYQSVAIYARSKGINLASDVTVVNANFALARSQLAAGRVDAAMVIEPILTLMLRENKEYRIIYNGAEAWREISGSAGWELVLGITDDFAKKGKLPTQLIDALQDVSQLAGKDADAVDALSVKTMKLPPGAVKESLASGRLALEFQPAWQGERKVLIEIMNRAVQAGFVERVPADPFIYAP